MDDTTLVARAVGGDRDAFAAIFDRYAGAVLDLCTAVLRDGEEAAEATLDSFLRAARELANLRDRSQLRLWLLAVARHEATARAETRRREGLPELGRPADAAGPGADDPQQFPWDPSAAMSTKERSILHLHLRHELDGPELGLVLGTTAAVANAQSSRLRALAETSVGALLLSRADSGSDAASCPQLTEVLAGWDGRFTPAMGDRVDRHVRRCDVCRGRRTMLLGRLRAMASLPFVSPPPWLRREVLLRMELAVSAKPLGGWDGAGFPPGIGGGGARSAVPRTGRRVATVAAVLVLVTAGALLYFRDDGGRSTVTASGSSATTLAAVTTTAGAPTTVARPATTAAAAPTTTAVAPITGGQTVPTQPMAGPAPTMPQPVALDRDVPFIAVGADAASAYVFGCPYSLTGVSAEVTDESAVTWVALFVRRPDGGEESGNMSFDGGRWRATIGDFGSPGQAVYWVEAADSEGNQSRSDDQVLDIYDCA